jgi:murein DD-endopeptidase MepM/ murein hydrolase activator NlpD
MQHVIGRFRIAVLCLVCGASLAGLAGVAGAAPQAEQARCFDETGYCINGRIREFWEANGGLAVFGLPIGPQQAETIDGQRVAVQWFERNRLELHPANPRPYDVQLGRLGAEHLRQQHGSEQPFARATPQDGCTYMTQTGHNICGEMLAAWRAYGLEFDGRTGNSEAENLALFGLPLSEARRETLANGQTYTVQWFERARFELHPQQAPPFRVQFGLLAAEMRGSEGGTTRAPLRYVFPVGGDTVQYGPYHHDYPATDIFCPIGSEFLATTSGIVDWVSSSDEWSPATNRPKERGGISVAIIGDDGWRYYGSHLSGIAPGIAVGVRVEAGQLLGWAGKSGNARATPPHVHFGISRPTTPDDWATRRGQIPPYEYLNAWRRGEMVTPAP